MIKQLISLFLLVGGCALPATAYNSLLEYDSTLRQAGSFIFDNCFTTGKIMLDMSSMSNTRIPESMSEASFQVLEIRDGSAGEEIIGATIARSVLVGHMGIALQGLVVGTEYLIMTDICSNSFVVAPYEIANQRVDCLACNYVDQVGEFRLRYWHAYGPEDIPYPYHCDDTLTNELVYSRGYGGLFNDKLCSVYRDAAWDKEDINKLRLCYVTSITKTYNNIFNAYSYCDASNDSLNGCEDFAPGLIRNAGLRYSVFYRSNPETQNIEMCGAVISTMLPILVGCQSVAPPVDVTSYDAGLVRYTNNTVCTYLFGGRQDLYQLGRALPITDETGAFKYSMKSFLKGDFHLFSTMHGCVKDLLQKLIVGRTDGSATMEQSFMYKMQRAMTPILYAAMVLFLSFFALKIMMSPQQNKPAFWFMKLFKMLFVYFMVTTTWWYADEKGVVENGLYNLFVATSSDVMSFFTEAVADFDPIGRCSYRYMGGYLLSNIDVPATTPVGASDVMINNCAPQSYPFNNITTSLPRTVDPKLQLENVNCGPVMTPPANAIPYKISKIVDSANGCGPYSEKGKVCKAKKHLVPIEPEVREIFQTAGARSSGGGCVVRLSTWDMVDCQLATVINLGLCKYDLMSMVLLWLIPLSLFEPGGFLVLLGSFILLFCLFTVTLRFAAISIMSMIALSIFIMSAPLFAIFLLFDKTKQMFDSWVRYTLGYMIYPGLLFVYIALIMMTINVVMFGDIRQILTEVYGPGYVTSYINYNEVCEHEKLKNNILCVTVKKVGGVDPCTVVEEQVENAFTKTSSGGGIFDVFSGLKQINQDYADLIKNKILELMLFAVLFSMLSNSVIDFIAQLTGLQGIGFSGETAMVNKASASGMMSKVGGLYKKGMEKVGKKAMNAAAKKMGMGKGGK